MRGKNKLFGNPSGVSLVIILVSVDPGFGAGEVFGLTADGLLDWWPGKELRPVGVRADLPEALDLLPDQVGGEGREDVIGVADVGFGVDLGVQVDAEVDQLEVPVHANGSEPFDDVQQICLHVHRPESSCAPLALAERNISGAGRGLFLVAHLSGLIAWSTFLGKKRRVGGAQYHVRRSLRGGTDRLHQNLSALGPLVSLINRLSTSRRAGGA